MSLIFGWLCFLVQSPVVNAEETAWLWWGYQQHNMALTYFSTILAYLGGTPMMGVLVLLISALAYKKQRIELSIFSILAFGGIVAIGWFFKELIARPRPEIWEQMAPYYGYSFPSNHSAYAMVFAGILVIVSADSAWQKFAIICAVLWCCVMGLSRMYLGAHFPTDVLGGFSLGLGWLCLLTWLFIRFNIFQHRASTIAGNHEVKL